MGIPANDPLRGEDGFDPDVYFLTVDLTSLTVPQLRMAHQKLVQIFTYLNRVKARAEADLLLSQERIKAVEAGLRKMISTQEKWKFEAHCRTFKEWREVNNEIVDLKAKLGIIQAEIENLDKRASLVSREQSSRDQEARSAMMR